MYLIKGDEDYFIRKKINEIIDKEKNDDSEDLELIKFYDFFTLEELADALNNTGLFYNKKIIIIKNPFIFNTKSKFSKNLIEEFINLIKGSINDPNIVFIFTQEIYKYDKNFSPSLAFNFINKNSKIIQVEKINESRLFSFVNTMIKEKGGKINESTLFNFLSLMPNNLSLIENEIDKLLLINKEITNDIVNQNNFSVANNIEFALSDAVLKWNSSESIIKSLNQQLEYGIDISLILSQISTILLNAKSISILRKQNTSNEEISKIINIHPYRVKLHWDFFLKIGEKKLNEMIANISQIDVNYKLGEISSDTFIGLINIFLLK